MQWNKSDNTKTAKVNVVTLFLDESLSLIRENKAAHLIP